VATEPIALEAPTDENEGSVDFMKKAGNIFELSATDLVGYLNCHHLTALDRAVAEGALPKPKVWDPFLQILSERGAAHEKSYVEHLKKAGLDVVRIDGIEVTNATVADTLTAMRRGIPAIVQAALAHQGWNGRADILRRIEVPSALGAWSYEPIDTKLARETKAGTILQLCLYADLLAAMQGRRPELRRGLTSTRSNIALPTTRPISARSNWRWRPPWLRRWRMTLTPIPSTIAMSAAGARLATSAAATTITSASSPASRRFRLTS
jgi:hypothetical protein